MWIIFSAASFGMSVVIHSVAVRLLERTATVAAFFVIGLPIGALLIGFSLLHYGLTPVVLAGTLMYAFACELYLFLFTLAGNSVSLRLMAELLNQPLRPNEIASFYRTERMVERRFEQLERANLIASDRTGYRLTMHGRNLLRILSFLRTMFRRSKQSAVDPGSRHQTGSI